MSGQWEFWIDRGVTGFRFDVVTAFLFDPSMKDNPPASPQVQDKVSGDNFVPYTYQDHQYDILPGDGAAYMEKLRDWVGPDIWMMGESTAGNNSISLAMDFTQKGRLNGCYTTDLPEGGTANQVAHAQYLVGLAASFGRLLCAVRVQAQVLGVTPDRQCQER